MGSVKKAIKIYARLKPADTGCCKYEVDKHINDDGSTDDILILNANCSPVTSGVDEYIPTAVSIHRPDSYKFRFSKVFDESSSQDSLFDEMCQPVLESALQGYNSTIFAYGQTGSGKTYTMTGSRQHWKNRGIIPRSLSYIFEKFNELTNQGYIASAFLSYLEIYNENGYDLLHPGFSSGRIEDLKKVQLLEDAQQQIHMKNLTVHPIKSEDEAMQLLYLGDHNRIIAETPMNEASTRSHCIFTIHLNIREGNSSTVRRSKVHLVDLAGSERLANSNSTGQLFHEARHINLALHYLEQVIVALGEAHRSHIPYRNSMMTSILRDSLGGNCMTSMVATISLEVRNLSETLSTCRFSQRVALVQNAATLNEETDPMLLIAQLKIENKRLKDIISNSSIRPLDNNGEPLSQEEVADCWKLVEKFMSDGDEDAILPVSPDMRMVQTCFRCLKMAVQMNKEEIEGIASIPTTHPPPPSYFNNQSPRDFIERSTERYTQDMTREQLVDCLRVRDAEIDVLSKMLRPSTQTKNNSKGRFCQPNHIFRLNQYETGDGPQQQHQQMLHHLMPMKKFNEYGEDVEEDDDGGGIGGLQVVPNISHPGQQKSTQWSSQSPCNPNYKNNEIREGTTAQIRGETCEGADTSVGGVCADLFDSDCVFIEGLRDSDKQALGDFIHSYKGREKLERVRDNLLSKRKEVDSIETQLRRNHANLNNLKVVLMSSDGGGEEEDIFMREAVDVQSQSIQKQERQLAKSKEEMRRTEESLKGLYAQLMSDFEGYRLSKMEYRPKLGTRRIPSEMEFALGASAASVALHDAPNGSGVTNDTGNDKKPLAEMTKGIVRGVGGAYSQPQNYFSSQKSTRSKSSHLVAPETQFGDTSSPAYQQSSTARACKSLSTSSRKDKLSARGKCPPMNSPRGGGRTSPKTLHQTNSPKGLLKAPPGTPTLHLLHQNQNHANVGREDSTDNLSYQAPRHQSRPSYQNYEISNAHHHEDDIDDDEEELLKELPMTGDETIDQEILSFFRTRQAVFKQLNTDKTSRVPNTRGVGGGGVLANYQQFS